MAWLWSDLTNEFITNLYLYGSPSKPGPIAMGADGRIRSKNYDANGNETWSTKIQVDGASYMSSGPGRFAQGRMAKIVAGFMEIQGSGTTQIYTGQ